MTEAELYDYLQRTFGIGDWDEATSEVPWWKFRATEVAKLKAMLKRRGATVQQVVAAAEYARAQGTPVHATYQLFALIPEAMRDHRRRIQAAGGSQLDDAIAEAVAAGEMGWADRLTRATGPDAVTVLEQWRNR